MDLKKKDYQALLLIGGLGTRLRPYTQTVPKPMVEIDGRPFLEFKIESLRKYGIKDFIFCVGHLGNVVEEYFGNGERLGINIEYSYEKDELLGTAGAIKKAEQLIKNDFIATNGDTFLDVDIDKLINFHREYNSKFTLVVSEATHPKTQELVELKNHEVINFHKRDTIEHENHLNLVHAPLINSGLYIMSKEILNNIPLKKVSLEQEIFPALIGDMKGFLHKGYVLDVADHNDWNEFRKDVFSGLILPSISGYKKIIRSRAPIRITFGGGSTDLPPYDKEYGGLCINATINKYAYSSLTLRDDKKINIKSDIINIYGGFETYQESFDSIDEIKITGDKLDLIKAVILDMGPSFGFDLYVRSEVPPSSGLGASASVSVSVIGVLNHLRKKKRLTKHEIAETAFRVEDERIHNQTGRQDQYASTFGGINLYEFLGGSNVKVNPVEISKDHLLEIEKNLLIISSGRRIKSSGEVYEEARKQGFYNESDKIKKLHEIKDIAVEMEFNLRRGNLRRFGELIREAWEKKKKFNPLTTNNYIDALIEEAIANGAIGARLMGAGGGGHILIYCNPDSEHRIKEILAERGSKTIDFSFDFEGLRVWEVREF